MYLQSPYIVSFSNTVINVHNTNVTFTGRYSFMWTWSFNGAQDTYTSCWEADVVAGISERNAVLNQRGQSTRSPGKLKVKVICKSTLQHTFLYKTELRLNGLQKSQNKILMTTELSVFILGGDNFNNNMFQCNSDTTKVTFVLKSQRSDLQI